MSYKRLIISMSIIIGLIVTTATGLTAATTKPSYVYSPEILYTAKPKVQNPDTIICSGGGAKGVAYAGSLKYLSESGKLKNVSRFMGASAGAIFSLLYYIGLTPDEADEIIAKINWPSLLNSNVELLDIVKNPWRLLRHGNMYKLAWDLLSDCGLSDGEEIEDLLRQILEDKGYIDHGDKISFSQLKSKVEDRIPNDAPIKSKDLYVVACSLVYGTTVVLSAETTPNMDVVTAIRASMAIPFVYTPVCVDQYQNRQTKMKGAYDVFVDGGTTYNYPIDYFDSQNAKTLGFVLEDKDVRLNPERKDIEGHGRLFDYAGAVVGVIMDNVGPTIDVNSYRTIFIDTAPISTLTFDMTTEQRNNAINKAYSATKEYFEGK